MKVGFETIAWGIQIRDPLSAFDAIAAAGFSGVEIAQRLDLIGVESFAALVTLLSQRRLSLTSLVGGTIAERLQTCHVGNVDYLYIEPWELDRISLALDAGFLPALHPRVFTSIRRLEDYLPLLEQEPRLALILDTAHVFLAGDDLRQAIALTHGRLAAVHLKDWTPEYGWSNYRYGRGFTDPGTGIVDLDAVLSELQRVSYKGWIIAEVDRPPREPEDSVFACADWLAQRGLLARPPQRARFFTSPALPAPPGPSRSLHRDRLLGLKEAFLAAAGGSADNFYRDVATALHQHIPSLLIEMWTCSPTQERIGLAARHPIAPSEAPFARHVNTRDTLYGIAMYRRAAATTFRLADPMPGLPFGYPSLGLSDQMAFAAVGADRVVLVPIYNSGNQNYVRILLGVYQRADQDDIGEDEWREVSRAITSAADLMLDSKCARATLAMSVAASRALTIQEFTSRVRDLIQGLVQCEGLSVFIVDDSRERLLLSATTGVLWKGPRHYYTTDDGLVGRVWRRREPLLTENALELAHGDPLSEESVVTSKRSACLLVPLQSSGRDTGVLGVVRCRNKRVGDQPALFTEEDATVLDLVCGVAAPYVAYLLAQERRSRSFRRITHEIKAPLSVIRATVELMRRHPKADRLFEEDYLKDIWDWTETMRGIVGNTNVFSYMDEMPAIIVAQPIYLMADVVSPAAKQVEALLRERQFRSTQIIYGDFREVPRLWVDKSYMQQIIFNLLSNAIKYAYVDPTAFGVEIDGVRRTNHYVLRVRDHGIGILPQYRERVFEEGFRTPEALKRNVSGDGLGLWVVRRLAGFHGGDVRVTGSSQPTEISVLLPVELAMRPPTQ